MGLDIRVPIGLMFAVIGLLLTGYGLVSDTAIYTRSLNINVNLWWGIVMLAFGVVMLVLGRRGTSAMRPAETTEEGQHADAESTDAELDDADPSLDASEDDDEDDEDEADEVDDEGAEDDAGEPEGDDEDEDDEDDEDDDEPGEAVS